MKSSAGTFSSRRVPPSPSGFSSSQSLGMAGREAAWPCGSPRGTARFGLLSSSRATTCWPRSARTRASVPAMVVLPEPPFPPIAIFIVGPDRTAMKGRLPTLLGAEGPARSSVLDRLRPLASCQETNQLEAVSLHIRTDPAGLGPRPPLLLEGVSEAEPEDEDHEADGADRKERIAGHPHPAQGLHVALAEELAAPRIPVAVLDRGHRLQEPDGEQAQH